MTSSSPWYWFPTNFFHCWKTDDSQIRRIDRVTTSTKPESRTAAIEIKDSHTGALSWWTRLISSVFLVFLSFSTAPTSRHSTLHWRCGSRWCEPSSTHAALGNIQANSWINIKLCQILPCLIGGQMTGHSSSINLRLAVCIAQNFHKSLTEYTNSIVYLIYPLLYGEPLAKFPSVPSTDGRPDIGLYSYPSFLNLTDYCW